VKFFFLEIDHIAYQKIKKNKLISKMQTYFSCKMPPKKVKIKKQKKFKYSFLILTLLGGVLSQRQVCLFEISTKF
jgi:hypothetical protein